jgi:hypothetical protein
LYSYKNRLISSLGGVMKKLLVIMGLLGVVVGTQAQTKNLFIREYDPATATTLSETEPAHYVGRFNLPMLPQQEDTFATYAYTYDDMVILSYADSNDCRVVDSQGNTVWSGIIMRDDYAVVDNLEDGVYEVIGSKEFSLISGDPWGMGLGVWTAVDEKSSPLSTKLLCVGPRLLALTGILNRRLLFLPITITLMLLFVTWRKT